MNRSSPLIRVPVLFEDEIEATVSSAMMSARSAQSAWARQPLSHRLGLLRKLRHLVVENAEAIAATSAAGRSRPIAESITAEIVPLLEACRFLEREAGRILAPQRLGSRGRPVWLSRVCTEIHREPFGVVLVIGPGNYPLFIPGVQVLHALVAGNAVLLKPGVGGGPAVDALRRLMVRAGFPAELVAVLPDTVAAARAAISLGPDKVLFTGSAATGQKVLSQLAPYLVPAIVELSGCDAAIVRADADLDLAAKALAFGLRLNNGATCMAPRRAFVHRGVSAELESRLARLLNHRDQTMPILADQALARLTPAAEASLSALLGQAIDQGAHCLIGGIHRGSISFPTVLARVSASSPLLQQDTFAPVLAMVTVADDQEALDCTNDCPFALTASIFSRDEAVAADLARGINAGVVTINDIIIPTADARVPFGGRNRSGFGVTRGTEGLLSLSRPKVITRTRGSFRPAFEPPQESDQPLFRAYLEAAYGHHWTARLASFFRLLRILLRKTKAISSANL